MCVSMDRAFGAVVERRRSRFAGSGLALAAWWEVRIRQEVPHRRPGERHASHESPLIRSQRISKIFPRGPDSGNGSGKGVVHGGAMRTATTTSKERRLRLLDPADPPEVLTVEEAAA